MSRELMLERIAKAQDRITQDREKISNGNMRQRYHFMAETGWINDPNGLIYYKGKYHFFYQYNPYHGFWENMHWGHAVSEDLLHWEYLPLALAPSEEYEDHLKGGCFSGSAIEHDGKLYLMYTAATNHGNGFVQTQCIAYSEDGIHFSHRMEEGLWLRGRMSGSGCRFLKIGDQRIERDGVVFLIYQEKLK